MKKSYALYLLIIAALGLSTPGCKVTNECELADENVVESSFQEIQENVFNLHCALSGCHAGSNPAADLDLSEGHAYDNLVGVPSSQRPGIERIETGHGHGSYLVMKLRGSSIEGARMPLGGDPLPEQTILAIELWIDQGAKPN